MKRIAVLVLAFVMVLGLAACGGVKEEKLIESYMSAVEAFDNTAAVLNENINTVPAELVNEMNEVSAKLLEYKTAIEEGSLKKDEAESANAYLAGIPSMMEQKLNAINEAIAAQ